MDKQKGKIIEVQPIHKVPQAFPVKLPERWVVWATIKDDKYGFEERVWLRTVADDSDALPLRQRSLLVRNFFETLIGQEIEYSLKYDVGYEPCYSAHESSVPKSHLLDLFSDIYGWFEKNRSECLENNLKSLRESRSQKLAAIRKEEEARLEEALRIRREKALKLAFVKGRNPKHDDEQWEAQHEGRKYILRREDIYQPSEAMVPVERVFDLAPDRVVLVRRI